MKRFQFRLQKLLEIREYKEKQVKNELAGAERKKYLLVEKKEKYLKEDHDARKKMRLEENKKEFTVERFNQYQQYFKRLKAGMKAQDKLINLADEEVKLINDKLIQARKEKRILERLKEKKLKKYMYEVQREEQNFFDEVGNNSFIMKKNEEQIMPVSKEVKKKDEIPIKYKEYKPDTVEQVYDEIIQKGDLLS